MSKDRREEENVKNKSNFAWKNSTEDFHVDFKAKGELNEIGKSIENLGNFFKENLRDFLV